MRGAINRGVAMVAALFGPTPKQAPSTDSLNEGARQYRLAMAVREAFERGLEVGDDSAIARLAAEYAVAPTDIMVALPPKESRIAATGRKAMQATQASRDAHSAEVIGEAPARLLAGRTVACPPFPPIETPSGKVPLDLSATVEDRTPVRMRNAIKAVREAGITERPTKESMAEIRLGQIADAFSVSRERLADALWPPLAAQGTTITLADAIKHWQIGDEAITPLPVDQHCTACGPLRSSEPCPFGKSSRRACDRKPHPGYVASGHYDPDWQRKAIEASEQLAAEHRVIAHRVESEAERRTRLLAEWTAHREADPMAAGRVPGEPMPRSEDDLIEQAQQMAGMAGVEPVVGWRFFFSLALTYLHLERAPFYEEHDGNRIVMSMLRSAKGRAT